MAMRGQPEHEGHRAVARPQYESQGCNRADQQAGDEWHRVSPSRESLAAAGDACRDHRTRPSASSHEAAADVRRAPIHADVASEERTSSGRIARLQGARRPRHPRQQRGHRHLQGARGMVRRTIRSGVATNVTGAMLMAREAAQHFIARNRGNIVNIASTAAARRANGTRLLRQQVRAPRHDRVLARGTAPAQRARVPDQSQRGHDEFPAAAGSQETREPDQASRRGHRAPWSGRCSRWTIAVSHPS